MKRLLSIVAVALVMMGVGTIPAATQTKGTPQLNIYFTKGFNDAAWQKAAFDRIARTWVVATPPAPGKKTVVITNVSREGKVIDSKLGTESGSAGWDKAAVEAVQKSAPFPALPKSWTHSTLEVHFHFEFRAS